jgi:predicted dienelactone hydrolase
VVFSTGLGQSRDGCAFLGRYWAARGFVAIHVQHPGSDHALMQRGPLRSRRTLEAAFNNPWNGRRRAEDLGFVLDRLERLADNAGPAGAGEKSDLGRCVDLGRIGIAGCDFGAQTALALAGQVIPGGGVFRDDRVRAVAALSPPVPVGRVSLREAYRRIDVPCLYLTGTEDDGIIGDTTAAQRRLPFDYSRRADRYLVTLYGADHMIYRGHRYRLRRAERDPMYQRMICRATTAFWQAYLQDDPAARDRLAAGGLKGIMRGGARVEQRITGQSLVRHP